MTLYMDEMIRCLSVALDAVESDFLGCSTHHGQRIATLCVAMGKRLGMASEQLTALACCALLHDNALTEYILSERPGSAQAFNMVMHCKRGQENVDMLPFAKGTAEGLVLYHHERADGEGPFHKKAGEFPLAAGLIAIADQIDSQWHLQRLDPRELPALRQDVSRRAGAAFLPQAAEVFLEVVDEEMLRALEDERIYFTVAGVLPRWEIDLRDTSFLKLAGIAARIIDYKSEYTKKHSVQTANIAWLLAHYYGFSGDTLAQVYLAGCLHDLGKLFVSTQLLEKPGALERDEYESIQLHAGWTRELLSGVHGLGDVCEWASNHHERLNGSGYPCNKTAGQLDFVSRLLACADVYQSVSDSRPYHPARSHSQTMEILAEMADGGLLDAKIVQDMDSLLAPHSCGAVPSPVGAVV